MNDWNYLPNISKFRPHICSHITLKVYIIRVSVDVLCRDGPRDPRTKRLENSAKTARMALETHQNTAEVHMYLHIGPKGPYIP